MAHIPKYILGKAKRLNKGNLEEEAAEKLAKEITRWLELSGVTYAEYPPYNRLVIALKNNKFHGEDDIKKGFDELMD